MHPAQGGACRTSLARGDRSSNQFGAAFQFSEQYLGRFVLTISNA